MKLIVNADDFGLSEAVNYGIVKSFTAGVVRSTTLMANMGAVEHALGLSKEHPGLGVGMHLTLTAGKPLCTGTKSLTDDAGDFWKQLVLFDKLGENSIKIEEVYREWQTQIEKARALGFKITHLDSHHHVHLRPELFETSLKLSQEYHLPIRAGKAESAYKQCAGLASTDRFSMDFYGKTLAASNFIAIIEPYKMQPISLEIMCHPAYLDKFLTQATGYALPRLDELEILTSGEVKDYISKHRIELVNYGAL